ncbi:MAG: hypothetical protein CMJ42_20210 [Phyllobacteriaceae bacterium]|nr:hypothetical protein [Phyllobacteriaceae bacterium]MBA90263.1 hypothetical protein [Phyllobacteriaceae bacterium]
MPVIRFDLEGSHTARCGAHSVRVQRGSAICSLARKMIREGHADPADTLTVYRGDTPCFRPKPIGEWAGLTVTEGEGETPRFRRFRECELE